MLVKDEASRGQRQKARFTQDGTNACQMLKKSHTSSNDLIHHSAPDSTRVIHLKYTHTHTHTAHCVGRHGITAPTASTLNSPKASSISKQGLNDLTLEGWQQPTFSFHLARRQGITEMNNSTQPR